LGEVYTGDGGVGSPYCVSMIWTDAVFLLIEVMNSLMLDTGFMGYESRQEVCTDGLYEWR
jgi:hypothetical protein